MKVLFLCNKSPFPPKEGGAIAMNALIEGLVRKGHQVKVIAVSSEKFTVNKDEVPDEYCDKTGLEIVHIDLRIKVWDAFLNLFSKKSYHVQRFVSDELFKTLKTVLKKQEFDIVQLETLYMIPYVSFIREHSRAKIVLRSHNIEHLIWEEIASNTVNPLRRWYMKHLAGKLKAFELKALEQADGIAAITTNDAAFIRELSANVPVQTIGFGVYPEEYHDKIKPGTNPRDIFHIGSMNWLPNQEGIRWFLKYVMPEVNQFHPDLRLYLAGRNMPDWLVNYGRNNVEVLGEVDDAWDFMSQHGTMVVPLFSGSGVRIKIVEAMLAGKPVISTSKGAQGLNCTNGKDILIADTRGDFLSAISLCLSNPEHARQIGENARELIRKEHNNSLIIDKLTAFYAELLQSQPA